MKKLILLLAATLGIAYFVKKVLYGEEDSI